MNNIEIDEKYKEVEVKFDDYMSKIKEGLRNNIQNDEIVLELVRFSV